MVRMVWVLVGRIMSKSRRKIVFENARPWAFLLIFIKYPFLRSKIVKKRVLNCQG